MPNLGSRRLALLAGVFAVAVSATPAWSACCYFSAKNADILQPAQKAFITFDAATGVPWSSSPTMIRVGALMALIRSVRLRPEIAWQHPM